MRVCLRCNDNKEESPISSQLVNFVCDGCRRNKDDWHWGKDTTIKDMEANTVEGNV